MKTTNTDIDASHDDATAPPDPARGAFSLFRHFTFARFLVALILGFLVWVVAAPFLAEWLIVERPVENADAMLVLAGAGEYQERVAMAAECYRRGRAPRILLTDDGQQAGWSKAEQRNPPFVELARRRLIDAGIPADKIEILEPQVDGTIEEARLLADTVVRENIGALLLVTTAYHTRRTIGTFDDVFQTRGLQTRIGITAAPTGGLTPQTWRWWTTTRGWRTVGGEYVKLVYYRVWY